MGGGGGEFRVGMGSWVEKTNLIFCSSYNASTRFQNLQKRHLSCRKHGTLQTCDSLWSMDMLSVL